MKLFNTLTQKKENFIPLHGKKVSLYVCGITPYDTTHLGHAFTYIFFDTLIRYLKFQGFQVTYTQNVTDINDRDKDILQRAKEQHIAWDKLADFWTKRFLKDMQVLNWIFPTHYLYASKEITSMIQLIQKLLKKNLAYLKNGSIYLDISQVKNYGKLSEFSPSKMLKIAKDFEEDLKNPDKKHPLDITLWRAATPNQPSYIPSFNSPWGKGRPGWHIECSAMALSTLGETISGERSRTIDIHGGGKDLIFPHHEAEIAQSEGATSKIPFVKYWLHTGTVYYQGEKMSKSKGNLVMISDLLKKYSANAIRWLLLSHHFQQDWEYKEADLKKAQENVTFIERVFKQNKSHPEFNSGSIQQFITFMDDNLNTPKALELLLELTKKNQASDLKRLYVILGFHIENEI